MADPFTSTMLKQSRAAARKLGVPIPKNLTTYQPADGYWEVYSKATGLVWQGSAGDAAEAKSNYIAGLLPADWWEGE